MAANVDELQRNVTILKSKIIKGDWIKEDVQKLLDPLKKTLEDGSLYESIQSECDDRAELWQSNYRPTEVLFQTTVVESNTELLRSLSERILVFEKNNLQLKEEVNKLKEKCKILDKIKKYRLTLMIGQLAVEIERKIVNTVLLDLLTSDQHINTIAQMEMAIQGNDGYDDVFETEDIRETARQRWNNLKSKFSWKGKHTRYIQGLKHDQILIAHPSFDQRKIEEALKTGDLNVRDKELFEELLKIYKQL